VNTAFQVVTGIGLILCLIFVIAFHIKTGGFWRRSEAGRWLMLGRVNILLLFSFVLLNRRWEWFFEWAGREWVLFGLYTLFALQTLWPLRLLWHEEPLPDRRERLDDSRT
jgi:hypothetical protein